MDAAFQDLRYSWRRLWRQPGFAAVAVLTLGLGIGANTALFSLINGLLFKALPIPHLDRLTLLTEVAKPSGRLSILLKDDDLRAVALGRAGVFDQFILTDPLVAALSARGHADVTFGELVSGSYFDTLGVVPRAGRLLQRADDRDSGADAPVVISEALWRRWFNSDPAAVGQPIAVAGMPAVIVGVAPDVFRGTWLPTMMAAEMWLPVRTASRVVTVQGKISGAHRTFAVLHPGISLAQANSAVSALGQELYPGRADRVLAAVPGRSGIMLQDFERGGDILGSALLALSGLVLLIACANLANLLLARGAARRGEVAVRMAIGASPERVYRLLLTETALITGLGGLAGIALTFATARLLATLPVPSLQGITISFDALPDARVFAYAFLTAGFAAFAVGLAPARYAMRTDPARVLATGGSGSGTTMIGGRVRTRLVGAQVAMSVVLLTGAGLCVRSALAAMRVDPGYDMSHSAVATVDLTMSKIDEARGRRLEERILQAVEQIPSVQRVALAAALPVASPGRAIEILPEPQETGRERVLSRFLQVSPGLFDTLGIPLRRGRRFSDSDGPLAPSVTILSERLASTLWPGQDPTGRRVIINGGATCEVIGTVADTATSVWNPKPGLVAYFPIAQAYQPKFEVIVRTAGGPMAVMDPLRTAIDGVAPEVVAFDVRTVADAVGFQLAPVKASALLLAPLGVLGFAIALLGVYGVISYSVSQRTREFGVLKALGANDRQMHGLVLRQGLRMLVVGVTPGLVLAGLGGGLLERFLYGVKPRDPLTFAVVPIAIILTGLIACYLPARRAVRVDASVALRNL